MPISCSAFAHPHAHLARQVCSPRVHQVHTRQAALRRHLLQPEVLLGGGGAGKRKGIREEGAEVAHAAEDVSRCF